ncbi:MAG: beta-ketoacyl-ACP synthase [Bdellovibrionota bacterium]|nr:beta-ketoacyl-ACP synthase [Bdellovibrionota bacterium]
MSNYYISDFAFSCHLGKSKEQLKSKLFDPNFKPSPLKVDLVSGDESFFFQIQEELPEMKEAFKAFDSRNNRLALSVMEQVSSKLDFLTDKYSRERLGIVCATSTTGMDTFENAMRTANKDMSLSDYNFSLQEMGNLSDFVQKYLDWRGPAYTVSTACSSGLKIFAEAKRLLDADLCDVVLLVAADTYCDLTVNGFNSLEATSKSLCNPFSKNRDGINIGEAGAVFILGKEISDFRLAGIGESSDAYHISSPEPEGKFAKLAIAQALTMAKISANDIGYLNLHGTATKKNDSMEALLVDSIFTNRLKVSSTKSFVGHCLGAAGAIELVFCLLALEEGLCPMHLNDREWDTDFPKLNFVEAKTELNSRFVMSNSFAFGGSNASMIVEKVK